MNSSKFLYERLIDGLRLAASSFKVQREVLPDFAHLPDEVLDAVDVAVVAQLAKAGVISDVQAQGFRDYDSFLNSCETSEDYEDALRLLESGEWFQELREKALALLDRLGKRYERPTLAGITYVEGAQPDAPADADKPRR